MSSLNFRRIIVRCLVLVVMLFQLSFGDMKVYASAGQDVQPVKPIDDLWVAPMNITQNSKICD